MKKREALKILIENSFAVPEYLKLKFITQIPSMTDEQVDKLGAIFAREIQFRMQNKDKIKQYFDQVIKELNTN